MKNSGTYESRYSIVALVGEANKEGLTLYEAVKELNDAADRGVTKDATHIRRDNRCVGFWCDYYKSITPMFGARDDEAFLIGQWTESQCYMA